MVTAIIWRMFDWRFAVVTCLAVVIYVGFTAVLSGRRGRYRRTMNDTDNDASTKSLDSLINYETVKYFGNEEHEAQRYDQALARYERAAVRVQVSLNALNLGQAAIISTGLTLIMLLAASGMRDGSMTVGKFVVVNTYLIQLYQPLNFLGIVYMTIKQGLVDMEQMFALLRGAARDRRPARRQGTDRASVGRLRRGSRVRQRLVWLPVQPDDIARHRLHRAGGRQAGDRRADGGGQIHHQPAALFRFYDVTGGAHPDRRPGYSRRYPGQPAGGDRCGAARHRAVQRHHPLHIGYGRPGASQSGHRASRQAGPGA